MKKSLTIFKTLSVLFCLVFTQQLTAQCPDIDIIDLRNTPGFSQLDDVTACGDADTLSFIVFSGDPGTLLGFELGLSLPDGIEYAGFQHTDFVGTSVSNSDPDPSCPEFIVDGFDADSIVVVNIGLVATCDVDLEELLFIDFEYSFTYVDTFNMIHQCSGNFTPEIEYNSSINRPVVNLLSPLDPGELTISSIGDEFCQTLNISQDGISAYLDSFRLEILGLEFGSGLNLSSVTANPGAGDYNVPFDHDPTTMETTMLIEDFMFVGNQLPNPNDNRFHTNEIITLDICYSLDFCPQNADLPFVYNASFGCYGETCQLSSQTSFIRVRPTGSQFPEATSSLLSNPAVCGDDGEVQVTITNPNSDTDQNKYTDLSVGFETCEQGNLNITEVIVNGISLPVNTFGWVGDDLNVDFSALPPGLDLDGTGGLEDLDGDGVFDDLAGGSDLTVSLLLGVECGAEIPDPTSDVCPSTDCNFSQFYVEGKTNCGNTFREFPDGITGFDIKNGGSASNPNEVPIPIDNPTLNGYDFGVFGATGASSQQIEFCYDFENENFDSCTDNEIFLQITFAGANGYIYDVDITDAEIAVDGGAYNTVPLDTTWTNIDDETRQFALNAGDPGANVCYRYTMEMDSTWCPPPAFWFGSQQVIERCNDASCGPDGCDLVRACRTATFYGDADDSNCPCIFMGGPRDIYRANYGYTDATKTTKLTRADVPLDDQTRFLPCDTLVLDYYWVITDQHVIDNVDLSRIIFQLSLRGNNTQAGSILGAPLSPNPSTEELLEFAVQKQGDVYADRQIVDLTALPECMGDGWQHAFEKLPANYANENPAVCSNSSNDLLDGQFANFVLHNAQDVIECGGNLRNGGGNCLNEFFELTNYAAGDTIRIKYQVELQKNPLRRAYESQGLDPGDMAEGMTIVAFGTIDQLDPNGGSVCNTAISGDCAINPIIRGACPGEISSVSQVTLEECGGQVEHTFFLNPQIPDGWFSAEFRPVFNITRIADPLFTPMAYCGNAEVLNFANGIAMSTPISPDSVSNLMCTTVSGISDDVCGVSSGNSGDLFWGPAAAGAMPLGLGNVDRDSLKVVYDFCLLCPEEISVLEYQNIYDYAELCENNVDNCHYNCNTNTAAVCNTLTVPGDDWIDVVIDSLGLFLDNEGPNVTITDNRTPVQGVTTTPGLPFSSLIASDVPGVSVEIQAIEICNPDPNTDATGVGASIIIPSSVSLDNVYSDPNGTMPLNTSVVTSTLTTTTYLVELPSDMLAAGDECVTIYIGTTLLFCPATGELPPEVCVSAISGCSPPEVSAALGGSAGCGENMICYAYVSGEVGLQTEWFDFPQNPELCEEMTLSVRVVNVKQLVLLDLEPEFNLPPGVTVVPGSWEVAYPGGPTTFGPWMSIQDPDLVSGNTYGYSDDALFSSEIDANGLEGVSFANATEDLNKVSFRFRVTTNCDEFLSGSQFQTETIATDPCAAASTSSGLVDSPPLIINGADPADNAQLLVLADPEELNCMATVNTFGITAINVSDHPTADSVQTCVTLPMELQYVPNSLSVVQPAGFSIAGEIVTPIGTSTEVCFVSPPIGQSQSMRLTFDAMVDEMAECGDVNLKVDIKSVVEAVACVPGPPDACDVFVQNSLNPNITIEIKPPFIAEDLVVFSDCSTDPSVTDLYYEWTINHNGPNASNQAYTVNFYQDIDGDMSVNTNIDNLLGSDSGTFTVVDGGTVQISGNVAIDADRSCPVIFEVVYETTCTCDSEEMYFDNIMSRALRDFMEPIAMCPGDCLDIEVCDFASFTADSIVGASGVEYRASVDWVNANCYNFPRREVNGSIMQGPPSFFINYPELTNNSTGDPGPTLDGIADDGLLFAEFNSCSGSRGEAYIVASYNMPVAVDSVYVGSGDVAGWTNTISVYSSAALDLEYSNDGMTWMSATASIFVSSDNEVIGYALPNQVIAQYWRISSVGMANWGTSEFRLEGTGIPFEGSSPVSQEGNIVTICIPEDQGLEAPWPVTFMTGVGQCMKEETLEIWNIGDLDVDAGEDLVYCEGDLCPSIEVELPQDVGDDAVTITWTSDSPTAVIAEPGELETQVCITEDVTFTVTVEFPGGCIKTDEIFIDFRLSPPTPAATLVENCYHPDPDTLTATPGFANYEWFQELGGNQIQVSAGSNTFAATSEGLYTAKIFDGMAPCPVAIEVFELVFTECVDLELTKNIINIPSPVILGSQVTYEIIVCNIADADEGLMFDATNVEVSDELPGAVTYVQHTQTSGNYSPTTNQWDITTLESGTCDTLLIDVTIDQTGMIENTAQVSGADQEDIDSTPNNDNGDQSEDEEDVALIEVVCENIAGEIFYDNNDNGCQDAEEGLVMEPINVSLYECGSVPGTDAPVAVTQVMNGEYEFGVDSDDPGADICLQPDVEYFVAFDIPNGANETLEDYTFSSMEAAGGCATDGNGDDVDPATGTSACHNPSDSDAGDGDDDNSIDAGITPPCYEMAGEIFYDNNNDGCQDPGEGLVDDASIEVSIYECGDMPGVDQPAASTIVTDGMYEFGPDSDDPGADICLENNTEYFVVFDIPNAVGEALEDYTFSENDAPGACAVSGESDNVDPATGASGCFDPDNDDGSDGDDDQNVDAGVTPPCETLGGEIFYDTNGNGCEDGNESLVMEPINVMLFECGDVPGVDPPAASTTVADGEYEFGPDSDDPGAEICLEPGTQYFVVFDIPMGPGEVLDGYTFTEGTASASCNAVGEGDDVDPMSGASDCFDPNDDDGADGSDDNSVDAGITPPCESLSGEIFFDYDDNGCQDGADMLVMMDVNVSLYECGDTPGVDPPAAATTVSNGEYMFGEGSDDPGADICLEAGTEYFVVFDIPNAPGEDLEGYEFSSGDADPACALGGDSDDVDPATGMSGCYDPDDGDGADGDGDNNVDAGITPPCESLGGEIFFDDNMDGCEDGNETLVTEVIGVMLYECGQTPGVDAPVASTFTNDGMYEFGEDSDDPGADVCLMPGTQYFVVFDIPSAAGESLEDYSFTMGTADAGCEALGESNDVDPMTGASGCFDPMDTDGVDGDDDNNVDAGITPPCESLSGEIFFDDNRDGCQDSGESLVMEMINVTLYECGDIPGIDTPAATTSVTDGEYEFGPDSDDPGADVCLDANTEYFVVFDIPNAAGEALEDYSFTEGTADASCAAGGESDDVDPSTGATGCENPGDSDGDSDDNMDAGITPPCESLGGEIFYDGNENGCQDPNEALVEEAINVTLYECGDLPGVDPPAASTTVTDGMYEFGPDSDDPGAEICLEADTEYFVVFDIPNAIGEALEEYEFSSGMADAACEADGNSDDVDPATGATDCESPGDGDGDGDDNMDAGITPPCEQISGEIFFDLDDNGCQDTGENLVMEDINVSLYECGDDPAVDFPVASTTVNDGMYAFGETSDDPGADVCLEAGTEYFVVFDIPNSSGMPLEGFEFSSAPLDPACALAGDSDDVDPATGESACYDPNNDDGEDGDSDENVDAGIVPPCEEIAGEIFIDENDNGCQDPGESLVMTNVTVQLYECGDVPGVDLPAAMTVVTDGEYEFGVDSDDPGADICLPPNVEYFVHFELPNSSGESLEDYEFSSGTADPACMITGQSDDVDPATGSSACHNPSGDDDDSNVDAGIVPPCESLGGEIFVDENRDGCEDPNESLALFDIEVSLYECGDVPGVDQPLASTTVSDGEYEFGEDSDDPGADICLEAGTEYFVAFDIPNAPGEDLEDYTFTEGVASGACALSGESDNVDPATGTSTCYDPDDSDGGDGDEDNNIDAGISPPCESLGGEIFYDDNANGCQDGGESLVMESINVMLFECGQTPGVDAPVASTNVSDGEYEFGVDSDDPGADICLEAGTEYFVVFDIPMGANEVLDGFEFTDGMASATCMGAGQSDDVDPTTGASGCYDPNDDDGGDGDGDNNIDAGISAPCQDISGEIFFDDNANGCQDGTEELVMEAIDVTLYECGDTPGVDQPVASTTVTDGMYEFGEDSDDAGADVCLEAGTEYFVVFDIPNAAGEALENFDFTEGEASGACATSGDSDNVDPNNGQSGCVDPSDNDGSDGNDDNNVDAGITQMCESISGEIFYDTNGNGCEDSTESLVMEDINVSLYECGDTPGIDQPAASTTVSDGEYEFGIDSDDPGADICLDANTEYFVVFDIPNGVGEALEDYAFTDAVASGDCATSGESDDVDPTTGASGCVNPSDDDAGDGDNDNNVDAGIMAPCESLSGEIFYDNNGNGCQDGSEDLVMEAINVTLYECGSVPGVDAPVASTSINDGEYMFGIGSDDPGADVCLEAGTEYFVAFDIPMGSGEVLDGFEFTEGTASPSCETAGGSDDVDPTTGTSDCFDPNNDDGADGDSDENVDAGITAPCESISGEIFFDENADGCQDDSEGLVMEAINVTLYECGDTPGLDQPVASTTVSDGEYEFGVDSDDAGADVCLEAGTEYFVVFDIPNAAGEALENFDFTEGEASGACATSGDSDDVDPTTGGSACVDPSDNDGSDGNDDNNIDAGITQMCESISGEIFYDTNGNGCEDSTESLVMEDINVSLYECGDTPGIDQPAASTTVSDGEYEFGIDSDDPGADICLDANTEYFVVFDIPNGVGEALEDYAFTDAVASGDCATSGESDDVDPTTGASGCVNPSDDDAGDGDDDNNVDAGIMAPCESLSGEIFYDNNGNGCQDGSEDLVMEAINVTLYECGSVPGVDAPVASTSINDGEYMFGVGSDDPGADVCLEAGTEYFVAFDIPMGSGEVLDGFEFTEGTASPSCETAGGSDDVDPTTGTSACFDPNNDDGADGDSDENVDAGITAPCESLGGEIFYDMNENGCHDSGESLVMEDIGVTLYQCGDTPGLDQPVASTTVSDGMYEFGPDSDDAGADVCLEAGAEYFVVFDIPMGAGEVLDGFEFTPAAASGGCAASGESDDVDPATGTSGCHNPDDNDGDDGDSDNNIDAGITAPCASLSGEIFFDNNGDGCQGKGDELVEKATNVTLYECGDVPGEDEPVATTFTDDGMYEFGEDSDDPGGDVCLTPGVEYFVVFDILNGPGEPLEDYCFGNADGDATCEALGDNNDVDDTGTSECGEAGPDVDAGIVPKCEQIAGEIFYDDNNNGCQDADEPLVDDQAIEVVLYQCGDVPGLDQPAAFTTVTDGHYEFSMISDDPGAVICLEAGDQYFVMFHIPNGPGEALEDYYFSENIASPSCLFSGEGDNIDPNTGMSGCHDPSDNDDDDGDADENIDAGIMHPCEILGGEIFLDYDNDGCHDSDESLVTEEINVTLYQCGDDQATASPVASITTTDGTYQFGEAYSLDSTDDPCLNPRFEYFVVFDFPDAAGDPLEDHYFSDGEDASCQGGPDSDDVHPDTGVSACYDPDNDDDDVNIDAGITPCEEISGLVYFDWNANGCQDDPAETAVQGVDVYIFECGEANPNPSNALASAVTDIDGEYKFGPEEDGTSEICLHPDNEYFVLFDIPNGDGELHEDFFVTDGDGATCAGTDSADDTDPMAATSECLDPDDDDDDDDVNAGITPCEEIGGQVFYDNDRDGCRDDSTEGGVQGVDVYVFECGTTDLSPANALASDSTNSDGEFNFGPEEEGSANVCLDPERTYFVVYDIPNATGESLDHFALTDGDGATCAGGDNSNTADPSTSSSACFDPDDDDDDEHINAGIMPCEELAGEVFFDDDADGCREEGVEEGVPGVDVYIFECGTTDTSPANALASTTTDDDGQYKFGSGEEGNADICLDATLEYFVLFDLPNDEGESLDSYEFTDGDSSTCAGGSNSDNIDPVTGLSGCYDPSGDENPNAGIMSPVDIALTKTIVTPGPYRYEESYTFDIEVFNEGELDLYNIVVNDFLPCGYRYLASNDDTWTFNPITEIATTTIPGPLVPNTSQVVQITLELAPCTSPDAYTNVAEVESMQNANGDDVTDDDVDSQGDTDPTNDNGEDDIDSVSIDIFDLALIKEIVTEPLYTEGDVIEFAITVVNQGNVDAHNIEVVDYLPIGYSFNPALNSGWDDSAAPSYFNTIAGALAPNDTVSLSFFATVEFVQQLQENYTNVSEISGATDADGNAVVDADSSADSNPNNDGTPIDDQFNDRGDEDDHDIASIELTSEFIPSCSSDCEIQCIGQINVSLDSMCMAVINPSTVGIGISPSCNDFYLTPTGSGLIVYDEFGNAIPGRKLGIDQIGQNLTYQLTEPTCGNRCWGNLLVEYKLPPQIECPDDLTLTCAEADALGLPAATGGCLELTFDVLLVNEVTERLDCDTLYTQRITRTYRAEDELGNFTECSHEILVERVDLTQVAFPDNAVISCSDPGFLFLPNGAPMPFISNVFPTGSGSAGVPVLMDSMTGSGSSPLIPVGGATIVDSLGNVTIVEGNANQLCNSAIVFTDVELPGTGCRRKFLRTFEVREWWCSGENVVGSIQQIEIVDDVAPEIVCPANFTVSTNDDCAGSVILPPAMATDVCGDNGVIVRIEHPNGLIRGNGGEAMLEVGVNQVRYFASDSCFNEALCVVDVTVQDLTEPVAICEQNTVVGISQSGSSFVFADALDDGSWDECGLDRFEVARLDTSCVAMDTLFDDKVAFCCTDVGQEVMVVFRAIDKAGNFNDCMVRVEVQDKQIPLVDCPDDQTVDCRLPIDLNNLGILFGGPNLTDNCPSTQNIVENVTDDLNQCGIGTITRKLQLLDTDGTTILRQCTQIIEVINEAPFVATNIQWPLAIDTTGACDVSGLNPEDLPAGFGFPTFTSGDDQCSLLGFDFVDEVFTAANGTGECARIERTWTVINWCDDSSGSFAQFTDPNGPQIITITNTVAPTIDPQGPVLVQSSNIDCTSGDIAINRTATDDCMNALSWTYVIRDSQGNTVSAGSGPSILTTLPAGMYTVTWNVSDFCGNGDSDVQDLEVQNTKSPTPICINGLSGMLVGDDSTGDGMIDRQIFELWASDVDGGSFHTCNNDIVVSLSPDPTDVNIVFDCDSIGIRPIRLYVTDMVTGVQDFCSTFINVQNNGECDMTRMLLAVEGEVMTENLETVEDVEVELGNTGIMDMTEEDGQYAFQDMPTGGSYAVIPNKDIDYLNGVSTLDIIVIQRHILGVEQLDSGYKLLAADVNGSENITAIDLIELRKLILGVYDELPNNTSWKFVDAAHSFVDPLNPWATAVPEMYLINNLTMDMKIDFVGVKIGDVNGSVIANAQSVEIEKRANRSDVVLDITPLNNVDGKTSRAEVRSGNYGKVTGLQGTIEFNAEEIEVIGIEGRGIELDETNYNMRHQAEGWITLSYDGVPQNMEQNDDVLFDIIYKLKSTDVSAEPFTMTSKVTKTEAYVSGDQIVDVRMSYEVDESIAILSVSPNPWIDRATIEFNIPQAGNGQWEFYDVNGKVLHRMQGEYEAGNNTIVLERKDLNATGIVYVKLTTKTSITNYKMMLVE